MFVHLICANIQRGWMLPGRDGKVSLGFWGFLSQILGQLALFSLQTPRSSPGACEGECLPTETPRGLGLPSVPSIHCVTHYIVIRKLMCKKTLTCLEESQMPGRKKFRTFCLSLSSTDTSLRLCFR